MRRLRMKNRRHTPNSEFALTAFEISRILFFFRCYVSTLLASKWKTVAYFSSVLTREGEKLEEGNSDAELPLLSESV